MGDNRGSESSGHLLCWQSGKEMERKEGRKGEGLVDA